MIPTLFDALGNTFTEGDRVTYASTNGIRVGIVEHIKEVVAVSTSGTVHVVYIDMSEHHHMLGASRMKARRVGYEYRIGGHNETYHHFLRVV